MESWVFLLSKFTDEALAIEALTICALTAGYAVFWAFRKRRLGSAGEAVPSNLVREHLSHLIEEATILRGQLFGLLEQNGVSTHLRPANFGIAPPAVSAAQDAPRDASSPGSAAQDGAMKELEQKLAQQSQATQTLQDQKAKLEAELAALKAGGAKAGATSGGDGGAQVPALEKKIKDLEEKLAEYSIIEDDLANLKRLQQENAQLKAALEKAGVSAPAPAPALAPTPVASAPAAAAPAAVAPAPETPAFEKVVDQVEATMAPKAAEPAPAVSAAPAAPEAPPAAAPAAGAPASGAKNDEDLLAEFEKMLNM